MSLTISLVRESDDEYVREFIEGDLIAINNILKQQNLPLHKEPFGEWVQNLEFPQINWSYRIIHYLRYFAARFIESPEWSPTIEDTEKTEISTNLNKYIFAEKKSHLICHSDCEGYYVPIDFETVIKEQNLPGYWLGSSNRLVKELEKLAVSLSFNLGQFTPNLETIYEPIEEESNYENDFLYGHKSILLSLYKVAKASVEYGSAIQFS